MMLTNDLNSSSFRFPDTSSDEYLKHTYHLDMKTSFILIVTDLIVLMFNFYFHYLIHRMALRKDRKNSQLVIQNLLACYSILVPITFLIVFICLILVLMTVLMAKPGANLLLTRKCCYTDTCGDWR